MRKAILSVLSVALVALFVMISIKHSDYVVDQPLTLPENHLVLENLKMVHVMGNKEGFATLVAKSAYLDKNTDTIILRDSMFEIKDSANVLITYADRGIYILNKRVENTGNVHGKWNNFQYTISPNGSFVYDFVTAQGIAGDGVEVNMGYSIINTKKLYYDGKEKRMLFSGGVDMILDNVTNE